MSVIGEAINFVKENSQIKFTDYYKKRLIKHVHATTGIHIAQEEALYLLKQLIQRKEKDKL